MSLIDQISLENEVFRAYAFWSSIMIVKMLSMSFLTGRQRFKNKVFANKEDLSFGDKGAKAQFGNEDVERVRRAHRNDLENCIPFLIIGLLYVLIDPSSFIAVNVIRAGVIGRILHTVAYLCELQPWRAIGFFICLASTFYMSFQVALFFY